MHARSGRFPLFDSLRAIAAISVVGAHAAFFSQFTDGSNPLRPYAARLDVGVAIFFLISGFLLYRPFVIARLRSQPRPATGPYAWRRFLRIAPGYWLALTVIALWIGLPGVLTAGGIPTYYGFAQIYRAGGALSGLPQAWTLCVEVTFYAFLPLYALVLRTLPGRSPKARFLGEAGGLVALFVLAIVFQGLYAFTAADPNHAFARKELLYLPAFLDQFAIGMGLAVLSAGLAEREMLPVLLRPLDRFPVLGWALALLAFWAVSTQIGLDGRGGLAERITAEQYFARHYLYAAVGLGLLLPAVFGDQRRGVVRKLLGTRIMLYLGLVSYGIYLWHIGPFFQFHRWGLLADGAGRIPTVVVWLVLGLGISVALASLSYWLVERPVLRLKRLVPAARPIPGEPASPEPGPFHVEGRVRARPGEGA